MNEQMNDFVIQVMTNAERDSVHQLLRGASLPLDGFDDSRVVALVAKQGARVIGSAAVERYPPHGLLRSLAVEQSRQGQGIGVRLVAEVVALATREQLTDLYLLTETAADFFSRLGFSEVERVHIPADVTTSVEFTTACPASARAYRLAVPASR